MHVQYNHIHFRFSLCWLLRCYSWNFHSFIFCSDLYLSKLTDTEYTSGTKVSDFQWLLSHQAPTVSALYAAACVTILYVDAMM